MKVRICGRYVELDEVKKVIGSYSSLADFIDDAYSYAFGPTWYNNPQLLEMAKYELNLLAKALTYDNISKVITDFMKLLFG